LWDCWKCFGCVVVGGFDFGDLIECSILMSWNVVEEVREGMEVTKRNNRRRRIIDDGMIRFDTVSLGNSNGKV